MIIVGPSQVGKTSFVLNLLIEANVLLQEKPANIIWCYGTENANLIESLEKVNSDIVFLKDIPDNLLDYIFPDKSNLLILDDLMEEGVSNQTLSDIFSKFSHHQNISVIFIMQDFYIDGKYRKVIQRNTNYLVLFANPVDQSQIVSIGKKILPRRIKLFMSIYTKAVSQFSYLFIDGHKDTPSNLMFRSDIFNLTQRVFLT